MARMRAGKLTTTPSFPLPDPVDADWPNLNALNSRSQSDDRASLQSSSSLSWLSNAGSVSSMSWIEDDLERESTQQVQELWNSVEDFLYEGKPLKRFRALEVELEEWAKHFPHLRLMCSRINLLPPPANWKPDPEDIRENEETYASNGSSDCSSHLPVSRNLESRDYRFSVSVGKVAELLSESLWDSISAELRCVLDNYAERISEPSGRPGSSFGPEHVVPLRVGQLDSVGEEDLELVDTDGSDEDSGQVTPLGASPSFLPSRGVPKALVVRRKSVPYVRNLSKFSPEPTFGSEPHLEAVKKIDKKVQRLSRQKSKSSPADVIELRAYQSPPSSKSEKQVKFKLPANLGHPSVTASLASSRASSGNLSHSVSVSQKCTSVPTLHLPPVPAYPDKSPSRSVPFDVYARARSATAHHEEILAGGKMNPKRNFFTARPSTAAVTVAPLVPSRYTNINRGIGGVSKNLNMRLKLEPLQSKSITMDSLTVMRMSKDTRRWSELGVDRKA